MSLLMCGISWKGECRDFWVHGPIKIMTMEGQTIGKEPHLHLTPCSTLSKYFVMCSSEKRNVRRAR